MLTPADRRALKARAHALDPVVIVGDAGLTPGVLAEIDRALAAHELVKVRVARDDRDARLAVRDRIVDTLGAEPVQAIGKLLVLWRRRASETAAAAVAPRRRPPQAPVRRFAPGGREISTRKLKAEGGPPRTARVRKSGQRSAKKPFQSR